MSDGDSGELRERKASSGGVAQATPLRPLVALTGPQCRQQCSYHGGRAPSHTSVDTIRHQVLPVFRHHLSVLLLVMKFTPSDNVDQEENGLIDCVSVNSTDRS